MVRDGRSSGAWHRREPVGDIDCSVPVDERRYTLDLGFTPLDRSKALPEGGSVLARPSATLCAQRIPTPLIFDWRPGRQDCRRQ
jgi:hypothetical protein